MMGRHDRARRDRRKLILTLVLGLVGALVAGVAWFAVDRLRDTAAQCPDPVVLTVVASPDIAPVVDSVARGLNPNDPATCYRVSMVANDSATTADQLAASTPVNPPAVWLPDSSVWLRRAR